MTLMKLELSQGKFALVDDDLFEELSQYTWSYQVTYKGKVRILEYASRYTTGGTHRTRKRIYLHRQVMNAEKSQWVDHINGDGLDCRRDNLRFCNNSTNQMNRAKFKLNGYSKFKGVSFYKNSKKWVAHIRFKGKPTHLGVFKEEKEAALAYNEAASKYFGEFAVLNKTGE